MLHHYVQKFLDYSQIACFSERSLRTLTARLKEFNVFIKSKRLKSPKEIAYTHLIEFVSDFKLLFVHVKKSRVWAVKQFFHFLVLNQWTLKDIARDLPYPNNREEGPKMGHGIKSTLGLSRN